MLSAKNILIVSFSLLAFTAIGQQKDSVWIKTASGCKVYNPYPQKNESITWSGQCVNDFASGEGTLNWYKDGKPGSHFVGTMKRGVISGKGQYYHIDGSVDKGTYERGQLNGPGSTRKVEDGRRRFYYEGEFKHGARNGEGYEVSFKPNGDTANYYIGSFSNDRRKGKARFIDYRDKGRALIIEGTCYNGKFLGSVRIWFLRNGKLVDFYEGNHGGYESPGVPSKGHGVQIDGLVKYVGEWANGFKNGKGKLYYDSTLVYDGEWRTGVFSGVGTRYYFDGSKYTGDFEEGKRHGVGKLIQSNGFTYTGEFKDDLYHGNGYFTTRDKKPAKCGLWKKGSLVRTDSYSNTVKSLESRFSDKLKTLNLLATTGPR